MSARRRDPSSQWPPAGAGTGFPLGGGSGLVGGSGVFFSFTHSLSFFFLDLCYYFLVFLECFCESLALSVF